MPARSGSVAAPPTRTRLLQAAADVVRQSGAAQLTLDAVAARAGVSKGGLLYHFPSKEALVIALLGEALDEADGELRSTQALDPQPVGSFARAYLEFVRERRHDARAAAGVLAAATLAEGDLVPARERFGEWHRRLLDDGVDPAVAVLVRTVADGLWLLDMFDLSPPTDGERALLFDYLGQLDGLAELTELTDLPTGKHEAAS